MLNMCISVGDQYDDLNDLINQFSLVNQGYDIIFESQLKKLPITIFNVVVGGKTEAVISVMQDQDGNEVVVDSVTSYQDVAGVKEVCDIMGWEYPRDKSMVDTYVKRGILPPPVQRLASGQIWIAQTIKQIKVSRDNRKNKRKK